MTNTKKKKDERDQAERFKKKVKDLIYAGELNPTEADERFERAMAEIAHQAQESGE